MHEQLMEFKRQFSWRYLFRKLEFDSSLSLEEFLENEFIAFQKTPWYEKSNLKPPSLPKPLEQAFEKVYSWIMQPKNWYKYQQNLSPHLRQAMFLAKSLPSQGIGIYTQDKSSRFFLFKVLIKTHKPKKYTLGSCVFG